MCYYAKTMFDVSPSRQSGSYNVVVAHLTHKVRYWSIRQSRCLWREMGSTTLYCQPKARFTSYSLNGEVLAQHPSRLQVRAFTASKWRKMEGSNLWTSFQLFNVAGLGNLGRNILHKGFEHTKIITGLCTAVYQRVAAANDVTFVFANFVPFYRNLCANPARVRKWYSLQDLNLRPSSRQDVALPLS